MLREILCAKKKAGDGWTTSKFRLELKKLLESEMEISSILRKTGEEKRQSPRKKEESHSPTIACSTVGKTNRFEVDKEKKFNRNLLCYFCQQNHWSNECRKFANLQARKERLKEVKRCIRCCRQGHEAAHCEKPAKCLGCSGAHPLALCPNLKIPQQPKFKQTASEEKQRTYQKKWISGKPTTGSNSVAIGTTSNEINATLASAPKKQFKCFKYCLLKCAQVKMFNPAFTKKRASGTVFVDSGSQRSMISERLAKELQLKPYSFEKLKVRGIGPIKFANSYSSNMVKIGLETSEGPMQLELLVVPGEHLPPMVTVQINDQEEAILETKPLEAKHRIETPDVLIGAKYLNELEIMKIRKLPSGFWLSESILGPMLDSEGLINTTAIVSHLPELNSTITEEESLVDKVRQFYQQDSLYLESDEQSEEEIDKAVHEQFKESLKFDEKEKRYEISLPFKNLELEKLPTNYALARGRLNSTLKKLRENPVLMEKYNQTMVQQHYEGIIEVAPRQADGPIHYLPHQYVWREDKQKLRVVFDASSHLGKSYCLNDVMHPGPLLLKDLAGILIRFRLPMIAISADIQAAFLQLKVAKEHRDVTRFLWPIDPYDLGSPVKALRFVRLTFGLNCSPLY
uniref:DUF1758 domain-containing protein n=1 Tax=Meloidogyne enterolobii TaxID=390850 RepID=A0A6V7XWV3_MELEN|nr:unnamed protein product [Meloidogyne enterolobii]